MKLSLLEPRAKGSQIEHISLPPRLLEEGQVERNQAFAPGRFEHGVNQVRVLRNRQWARAHATSVLRMVDERSRGEFVIVRLAGCYEGAELHTVYAIDPSTGQELNLDVDLALSRVEVDSCFAYECIPEGAQEAIPIEIRQAPVLIWSV